MKTHGFFFLLMIFLFVFQPAAAFSQEPACWLLDEPQARNIMTSTLEMQLLKACGHWQPDAFSTVGQTDKSNTPQSFKADDVLVNDPTGDPIVNRTQSECALALRPSDGNLVGGWNDSSHSDIPSPSSFCGYGTSDDGGLTWTDGGPILATGIGDILGDPDIAVDSAGTFWYSAMVNHGSFKYGLVVTKSIDGGFTFGSPVLAHAGSSDDKVLMAIDSTGGAHDGNIYVCAVDFSTFSSFNLFCTTSTNGGASFGAAKSICPTCSAGSYQAPYPVVGPDGTLYVAWSAFITQSITQIQISQSTDGGQSFQRLPDPMAGFTASSNSTASIQCGRNALNGKVRYMDFASLAVGQDGVLHILYSQNGAGDDDADIMYVNSEDGQTWSVPLKINDDATESDNFMPTLAVNENGILGAYWYDRREDASNFDYKIYGSRSLDGGAAWTVNVAISDDASEPYSGADTSNCYMSDYNKTVADQDSLYVIWSDNRRITATKPDPDVYFDILPLCDNENAAAVFDPPGGTYTKDEAPLTIGLTVENDDPDCPWPGAIYYTTDGSEPTTASTLYDLPFAVGQDTEIRVLPFTCCDQELPEQSASYLFEGDDDDDTGDDDDDDETMPDDDDNDDSDEDSDDGDENDDSGCGC